MRVTVFVLLLSVLILLVIGLGEKKQLQSIQYDQVGESTQIPSVPTFTESSLARGVFFEHRQNTVGLNSFVDTLGAGVCIFDVNGDGWLDLLLVGGSGTRRHFGKPAWWSNNRAIQLLLGDGRSFVNATEQYGIKEIEFAAVGCAAADLDADGQEEFLLFGEGVVEIYDQTKGTFQTKRVLEAGTDVVVTSATFLDANQDGRLDVYVTSMVTYEPGKNVLERFSGFSMGERGAFDPALFDAAPNYLLVNQRDLHFVESATDFGVTNQQGRSIGAKIDDFNQDGFTDLMVINDFGTPNQIFINQFGERFSNSIPGSGQRALELAGSRSGEQVDGRWIFGRGRGLSPALLENNEGWIERSRERGFGRANQIFPNSWGMAQSDLNSDGITDVILVNGDLEPDKDAALVSAGQKNQLLLLDQEGNVRSEHFTDRVDSSRGVALGDLDNDGDEDVVIANNNGRFLIYDNDTRLDPETQFSWIGIDFSGRGLNAEVEVELRDGTSRKGHYRLPQGLFSQSAPRIRILLPAGVGPTQVKISQGGKELVFPEVEPNAVYRVEADESLVRLARSTPNLEIDFSDRSIEEQVLLAKIITGASDKKALELFWITAEPQARVALLDAALDDMTRPKRDLFTARLIQLGLSDSHSDVQVLAIALAKQAEIEASVDWLIPHLFSDSAVSCAVSELFEHFFDEEEAVIRRKHLAIKGLMKVANEESSAAACALSALGATESKRVIPLLHKIIAGGGSTSDEAIEAAGRIRDTSSIALIKTQMDRSDDSTLLSRSMIALVRLGEQGNVLNLLEERSVSDQLNVVATLSTGSDTAVIGKSQLSSWVAGLKPRVKTEVEQQAFIEAVLALGDRTLLAGVFDLGKGNAVQRIQMTAVLQQHLPQRVVEQTAEEIERILTLVPGLTIAPKLFVDLVRLGVDQNLLQKKLIKMNRASLSQTLELLAADVDARQLIFWLRGCSNSESSPVDIKVAGTVLRVKNLSVDRAVVNCVMYGPRMDVRRKIENRLLLKAVKRDLTQSEYSKLELLASEKDDFYELDPAQFDDNLRAEYLQGVVNREEVLMRWLQDERVTMVDRLRSLAHLARLNPEKARQQLRILL